jgi:hypothetical protein
VRSRIGWRKNTLCVFLLGVVGLCCSYFDDCLLFMSLSVVRLAGELRERERAARTTKLLWIMNMWDLCALRYGGAVAHEVAA